MILSYKSSEFNSLLLVTLSVCIFNILGIIIPQLLATFGKADSPEYYEISDWILSGSGIFPPIARLANKRFCRLLSFRRQKLIKYNPFQEMGIIKEQGIVTYQPLESVLISEVLEHEKKNKLVQISVLLSLNLSSPPSFKKVYKRTQKFSQEEIESFKQFLPRSYDRKIYSKKLKIEEYYPQEFAALRASLGYSDLIKSLNSVPTYNKLYNLINEEGGRSDAFIFSTYDQKFIIKTITSSEAAFFLRSFFENYLKRIMNFHKSKLVRIIGVYKIKPKSQFVIIMESLIMNKENSVIFDLKGSKLDRFVEGIDNPLEPPFGIVLKDENFRLYQNKICVGEKRKKEILDVLRDDILLLEKAGITDYSVLISIFEKNSENLSRCNEEMESGKCCNIGIIDILGQFGLKKLGEQKLKSLLNKKCDISASSPADYSKRLISSIENYFT